MTNSTSKPSLGFWIIAIFALIWNSLGIHGYLQQAYNTEAFRIQYSTEQLTAIDNLPSWYAAVFAIAVFSSTIGCLLMLAKKKTSNLLFKIGLLAVIIQTSYNLFIYEGKELYGPFEYSMLVMIPAISIYLVWYSKGATLKGWLT